MNQQLRQIPPVYELLNHQRIERIMNETGLGNKVIKTLIQQEVDEVRTQILNGTFNLDNIETSILNQVEVKARNYKKYHMRKVINGTGTILHTNLGRARLSEEAVNHVVEIAKNYSNLEFKIEEGVRGSRHDIVESLLTEVTGAEAAMVVNNNAAAVYLVLRALAKNKEVIVSRGELVEIGGSFRVSSIMEESDAKLIEVGTTNKTHPFDYENAITEETAMIMKVHTSNFKVIGFTESVSTQALMSIREKKEDLILFEDLGSGALYNLASRGIGEEPHVKNVIKDGIDLVSFSGDKLLGGPQAGIIAGKKELIQKLKSHQLARVLRVDKMTLAALEATLYAYVNEDEMQIPTIRDILQPVEEIKERAMVFLKNIVHQSEDFRFSLVESTSQIGGGTMPEVSLPTYVVTAAHNNFTAEKLGQILRNSSPCIVPRISHDQVVLDFRSISDDELSDVIDVFKSLA